MPPHRHQEAHVIQPVSAAAGPGLSPDFNKAMRISRSVTVVLAIGFWVTLAWLALLPLALVWPAAGEWGLWRSGVVFAPAGLSLAPRAGAVLAIILSVAPSLLILHHGRRIFANFAGGNVFVPSTIAHIRALGLWLTVSGIASGVGQILFNIFAGIRPAAHDPDFKPVLIVFGIGIAVAAYVMAEAQRIADDNAAII
jgi:hypothetical protein